MDLDKLESAERKAIKNKKVVIKDKNALMSWLFSGPSNEVSPVDIKEVKPKERKRYITSKEYMAIGNEKKCRCCFDVKNVSEYYLHDSNRDGYNGQCKKCVDEKRMANYHSKEEVYKFHVENNSSFKCKKCNKEKSYTEFDKNFTFAEGFKNICRECERS